MIYSIFFYMLQQSSYLAVLIALLLLSVQPGRAQSPSDPAGPAHTSNSSTHYVGGIVTDEYGKPLSGVRVQTRGENNIVFTNTEGNFHIESSFGKMLIFSHPQFDVMEYLPRADTMLPIRMTTRFLHTPVANAPASFEQKDTIFIPAPDNEPIDVLYERTDRESFLGSISTVDRKALEATPATNYLFALQGRLTGLNIAQTSGYEAMGLDSLFTAQLLGNVPNNTTGAGPTDNSQFNIQLRGHAASSGQNPIAIVDGVQRELYSIDPRTIQSVSILKDPLSNLLLGQNSSRGAIIVTTNEPRLGPTRLNVTAETGTQTALGLPAPLPAYQYAYLLNEALQNNGKPPAYSQADFDAYRYHTDPIGHPDVNWYHTILRSAPTLSRLNLNASGGTALARYVIDLSYMNDQGMFVTTDANQYNTNVGLQRYLLNTKVDVNVNKYFTIRLQVMGRVQDGNQPGLTYNALLSNLLSTPNNAYPVLNPNGTYGGNANYTQNLLAQVESSGYNLDHLKDVLSNVELKYSLDKVTKGLWVKGSGNVSVQSETTMNRSLQTPVTELVVQSAGDTNYNNYGESLAQNNHYQTSSWARYRFVQLTAGYDRRFGDHSVSAELLFDQKRSLLNYDLPEDLTNFGGKAAYSYKDRYFIQGAADYSGYNRYEPGHQYGLFYAGGVGWDISREAFFRNILPVIDHLKLRATYGLTGNANVDYYGYYIWNTYFSGGPPTYPMGSTYNGDQSTLAEGGAPGSQYLANTNATWERADKFDGGLDMSLLHDRVVLTADYYHERYFDVMQDRGDNVALVGINYPAENIGVDLYQGLELELTYQDRVGRVNYFVSGNAAAQQSKIIYMDEQYEQNPWNVHTGRPVNQLFGYVAQGLFQTAADAAASPSLPGYTQQAGDIKYKDLNGDGSIDQFDLAPIAKPRPLVIYGLSAGINYLGFELSALLQGDANRVSYVNRPYYNFGFLSQNNSYSQAYTPSLGRWIPENGTSATAPRLTAGGNTNNGEGYPYNTVMSSYWVHNGDFFRVKNVSLAYNLPYRWLRRAKVGDVKIFVNAQNLWTWAAFRGIDPEVSMPNYPLQRVLNAGINVKL
jgi:TonB-linked SusC/RagA family outer membrane protein